MNLKISTEASIWSFDFNSNIVARFPKVENPNHPDILYAEMGKPEEFVRVNRIVTGNRLQLHVKLASGKAYITGQVIEVMGNYNIECLDVCKR